MDSSAATPKEGIFHPQMPELKKDGFPKFESLVGLDAPMMTRIAALQQSVSKQKDRMKNNRQAVEDAAPEEAKQRHKSRRETAQSCLEKLKEEGQALYLEALMGGQARIFLRCLSFLRFLASDLGQVS